MVLKKKSETPTSAELDICIKMMFDPSYGEDREIMRALLSDPIDPNMIRSLTEIDISFMGIIQQDNFLYMIPDTIFQDISMTEIFILEEEDIFFLLDA